jgi:hypothetical protein
MLFAHVKAAHVWGLPETVRQLVRGFTGDAGSNRGVVRAGGLSGPDHQKALVGDVSPLDSRADNDLDGGAEQPLLSFKAKGHRVPDRKIHDRYAVLLRR